MPTLSVPIGQHALAQFTGQWTELAHELHVLEMQLTAAHAGRKDPAAIVRLSRRASRLARDFARDRQLFELLFSGSWGKDEPELARLRQSVVAIASSIQRIRAIGGPEPEDGSLAQEWRDFTGRLEEIKKLQFGGHAGGATEYRAVVGVDHTAQQIAKAEQVVTADPILAIAYLADAVRLAFMAWMGRKRK